MFFHLNSHPFYILSSEIDLHKSPYLRLLQLDLCLNDEEMRKSQDVIRWFDSICETVMSNSLVVEVIGFTQEAEICDRIQDTLLALRRRTETFSVYLTPRTKEKGLFFKLYEVGIVVEEDIDLDEDKQVGSSVLTSYLLYSLLSFLVSPILPPMSFHLTSPVSWGSKTSIHAVEGTKPFILPTIVSAMILHKFFTTK